MKKGNGTDGEMRDHYDFIGGVCGKYAAGMLKAPMWWCLILANAPIPKS